MEQPPHSDPSVSTPMIFPNYRYVKNEHDNSLSEYVYDYEMERSLRSAAVGSACFLWIMICVSLLASADSTGIIVLFASLLIATVVGLCTVLYYRASAFVRYVQGDASLRPESVHPANRWQTILMSGPVQVLHARLRAIDNLSVSTRYILYETYGKADLMYRFPDVILTNHNQIQVRLAPMLIYHPFEHKLFHHATLLSNKIDPAALAVMLIDAQNGRLAPPSSSTFTIQDHSEVVLAEDDGQPLL